MNCWNNVTEAWMEDRYDRRPDRRECVTCGTALTERMKGQTCPRRYARCWYQRLAADAGALLPGNLEPAIVRPERHEPEMLVPFSLADLASELEQQGRAA